MASPVRLLHRVQVVLALLHFAISVFQEVSVNSFPVTPFLVALQAVTGLPVLVRRPVTGFVTSLLVLVHSYSHFVLYVGDVGEIEHEERVHKNPGQRGARSSPHSTDFSVIFHEMWYLTSGVQSVGFAEIQVIRPPSYPILHFTLAS